MICRSSFFAMLPLLSAVSGPHCIAGGPGRSCTGLLDDLRHRAGADRAAAFADGEAELLFHGDGPGTLDSILKQAGLKEKKVMRYAVVIEKAAGNYSGYVPDLPGCIATGATVAEVENELREAIRFHIEGLQEDGLPVPEATTVAEYVEA